MAEQIKSIGDNFIVFQNGYVINEFLINQFYCRAFSRNDHFINQVLLLLQRIRLLEYLILIVNFNRYGLELITHVVQVERICSVPDIGKDKIPVFVTQCTLNKQTVRRTPQHTRDGRNGPAEFIHDTPFQSM